jgi:hypothetical protein
MSHHTQTLRSVLTLYITGVIITWGKGLSFFFFAVLGFELMAYTLSPFFVKGFFEIESCKLFAQAGFELQSSCSGLLSS